MLEKDVEKIVDKVLDSIVLKTVFIKGTTSLSKTITWGLNNQIPITNQDFIGVSSEVDTLNTYLKKYQLRILKTGEVEKIYTGLTPLEFMKLFYIVEGEPGKSKNFNKSKLGKSIADAVETIKKDDNILKQIDVVLEVEKWWDRTYRTTSEKSEFLRYGKNYFQSFVIYMLDKKKKLNSLLESDLNLYYQELESLVSGASINDYKSDMLFSKIKEELKEKSEVSSSKKQDEKDRLTIPEYLNEDELTHYIKENKTSNYSISATIKKFNSENNIRLEYFRTISYMNGKVKESFPLPNATFEEFYKRDGYLEDNDYPQFKNSLFNEEIEKEYPVFLIHLNQDKEIKKVKFISNFSIKQGENYLENAKIVFSKVRDAFIYGDVNLFPKLSSDMGFHIRPKAINGNDTFKFSDGTDITKRTFWVNANYIKEILEKNEWIDE